MATFIVLSTILFIAIACALSSPPVAAGLSVWIALFVPVRTYGRGFRKAPTIIADYPEKASRSVVPTTLIRGTRDEAALTIGLAQSFNWLLSIPQRWFFLQSKDIFGR